MCREAFDDFKRFLRDREANSKKYRKLTKEGIWMYCSCNFFYLKKFKVLNNIRE